MNKKFSFFKILKELMIMRFKALGWRTLPAVLASIASGLTWGFGVSAMQYLFDAVERTVANPGAGILPVVQGMLLMGGIMISELLLENALRYMETTHGLIVERSLFDKINRKAAFTDPAAYENTNHLEDIEKAKNAIGKNGSWFTWGFIELFTFYVPFFSYMSWYLYNLRPLLLLVFVLIFLPTILNHVLRIKIMINLENKSAPIRREFDHYENAICAREYYKETRHLGAFNFFFGRYLKTLLRLNKVSWQHESKSRFFELAFRFVILAGYGGVVTLLLFSLKDGYITIGAFVAVFASIERLFDVINSLVYWGYLGQIINNLPYMRNLMNFFHLPERQGKCIDDSGKHGISVKNASFTYPGRDEAAINDISLEIKPGEIVAFVGVNGAGKSTLVKLMTGLFLPTDGDVSINGTKTSDISLGSLFNGVSGVFQNYQKYKLTASENITISDISRALDEDYILKSTQNAGVEIESGSYPKGLDTMLSREFDDGVDLSGGQWQRLAIARGLYRTHDFIVLDEPTAAIDPIEETFIYKRFMELSKGKTAILVTHRLGSAKIAGRIFVLEAGRIVEEGDHDTLIAKNGVYAQMYNSQVQWYERDNTPTI